MDMGFVFPPVGRPESISPLLWNDWKWQLRHISAPPLDDEGGKKPAAGSGILPPEEADQRRAAAGGGPSDRERGSLPAAGSRKESGGASRRQAPGGGRLSGGEHEAADFPAGAAPYYLRLIKKFPQAGLRAGAARHSLERARGLQQMKDPLGEDAHSPAPRLIHRYPDRVLLLATDICGVYCRYCTRKKFTGKGQAKISGGDYQRALSYIKQNPGIREVILSGGDPLTLSDSALQKILGDLRAIRHVEIIRAASRMPAACPMRLTPQLAEIFKKHNPVFLMTHFNHPAELTKEAAEALGRMADAGILMFNQTVLLNGINNHPAVIQALMRRLLYLRVKPYYMFQCDPSEGTDHFRTSIENSQWIQRELWGALSGLALPALSADIPHGGGKAGFAPNFLRSREGRKWSFQGWDGVRADYISPPPENIKTPPDWESCKKEWLALKNQPYGGPRQRRFLTEPGKTRAKPEKN